MFDLSNWIYIIFKIKDKILKVKVILNIIVNYNNQKGVFKYLYEINNQNKNSLFKLILVDNSKNFDFDKLNKINFNYEIVYLNPKKNLGYYGAADFAFKHFLKNNPIPKITIVSNTDIKFCDKNFFMKLLRIAKKKKETIISPLVLTGKSKREWLAHTYQRPSIKRVKLLKFLLNNKLLSYVYNYLSLFKQSITNIFIYLLEIIKIPKKINNKSKIIYAPNGAFTIFPKSFFLKGGNFKLFCFMFGEEVFVAEQAIKLKLKVEYNVNLKLIHKGYSTLNVRKNSRVLLWKKQAVNAYYDKYFKIS